VILHTCVRKNIFRGKLASWNLEFCNSCVVLLRNVQVPQRNSDSHLVCCDPSHLRAKKLFRGKLFRVLLRKSSKTKFRLGTCVRKNVFRGNLAHWNLEFSYSCVVILRNVQVPRRNSNSHLVCRDSSHFLAEKPI
jgi:hypothetical protein